MPARTSLQHTIALTTLPMLAKFIKYLPIFLVPFLLLLYWVSLRREQKIFGMSATALGRLLLIVLMLAIAGLAWLGVNPSLRP